MHEQDRPEGPGVLPFTREGMMQKVGRTPISTLLWNVVGMPHDEYTGTGMQYLQRHLQRRARIGEKRLDRIFDSRRGPRNLDEEELLRLINLRGALYGLVIESLSQPILPSKIKEMFSDNAVRNARDNVEYTLQRMLILEEVFNWGETHPEEDSPLSLDEPVKASLGSIYNKSESLVGFYQSKRPLVRTGEQQSDSLDKTRARVVDTLFYIFDPEKPVEPLDMQ